MIFSRGWIGVVALPLIVVAACQQQEPTSGPTPSEAEATPALPAVDTASAEVNWTEAGDCLGMLSALQRGLDDGRVIDLEGTPFLLISDDAAGFRGRRPALGGSAAVQPDAARAASEPRCVLRIGPASERRSDHRVLDREQVRSRYQSGTRREKNPAYEVAKTRLRQAEKAAKPGKSSIIKVGDPLLDLVGTVVGGALTGLGQWGAGDQLEEALDTLMATPPSVDHPVYKTYHFERARIRANREATLPVTLTDRRLQQSWQASFKRRELRDLFVVTGLDRQDEDYARHSRDSLTEDGLRQWLDEAPSPPLIDVAAVLLDRSSAAPIDRVALTGHDSTVADAGPFAGDQALDAAASPPRRSQAGSDAARRRPKGAGLLTSRIKVIGAKGRTEGVFVAPHFVLTSSDVVGESGLVDVENGSGHVALGLVAAVDRGLGLALIQAPQPGLPIAVGKPVAGSEPAANATLRRRAGPAAASALAGSEMGAPLLSDGRLVGFRTSTGPDIQSGAIRTFLDRQQHLLPAAR